MAFSLSPGIILETFDSIEVKQNNNRFCILLFSTSRMSFRRSDKIINALSENSSSMLLRPLRFTYCIIGSVGYEIFFSFNNFSFNSEHSLYNATSFGVASQIKTPCSGQLPLIRTNSSFSHTAVSIVEERLQIGQYVL